MAMVSANISNFGDMDDATANLILELQLSDINTMQSSSTGKGRKGELTDAELALSLLQQNLEEIFNNVGSPHDSEHCYSSGDRWQHRNCSH